MSDDLLPAAPADPDGWRARHQDAVEAWRMYLGPMARPGAGELAQRLPALLDDDEQLIAFFQAQRKDTVKSRVLVCLTQRRLVLFNENIGQVELQAPLGSCTVAEQPHLSGWSGWHLDLTVDGAAVSLRHVYAPYEALRLHRIATSGAPPEAVTLLPAGTPADPGCPALAYCGHLALYPDRLVDWESPTGQHLPFAGGETHATVDTAGNIAVTRGRNLAAKGAGTLLFGPVGLLMAGNAKQRATDTRELFLLVEGPGWAYTKQFRPDDAELVRSYAAKVNVTARARESAQATPQVAQRAGEDPVGQLAQLADMRERGLLDDAEFVAAKAKLLGL